MLVGVGGFGRARERGGFFVIPGENMEDWGFFVLPAAQYDGMGFFVLRGRKIEELPRIFEEPPQSSKKSPPVFRPIFGPIFEAEDRRWGGVLRSSGQIED